MTSDDFNDIDVKYSKWITHLPYWVFVYSCIVALLVQCWVLPSLLPQLNAVSGMLKGLDSVGMHQLAVRQMQEIQMQGWAAWQLRPEAQILSGIASALYVLIYPSPVLLIPILAAIHALSCFFIIRVASLCGMKGKGLFFSVVPYAFLPTSLLWTTQLLKEGIVALGFFLIVGALFEVLFQEALDRKKSLLLGIRGIIGSLLVFVTRPYLLTIFQAVFVVAALTQLRVLIRLPSRLLGTLVVLASLFLFGSPYIQNTTMGKVWNVASPNVLPGVKREEVPFYWARTSWLPDAIDRRLMTISANRKVFELVPPAKSDIDRETEFHSASEVISFFPRAFQIALFAPFPIHWFARGTGPSSSLMRVLCGFEMCLVYFLLIGMTLNVRHYFWKREFWFLFLVTMPICLILSFTVINLGTLHRMRYPYLMFLLLLAPASWFEVVSRLKGAKKVIFS